MDKEYFTALENVKKKAAIVCQNRMRNKDCVIDNDLSRSIDILAASLLRLSLTKYYREQVEKDED